MIVVDTNVIAYRWLPGPKTEAVEALVRLDPVWAAPLLWRSELRNVLAGYVRRGQISVEQAEQAMSHAASALRGGDHAVGDAEVFALVAASACSAYDCEFVVLAEALDTVLVTEDTALLKAFSKRCRSIDAAIRQGVAP